MNYIQCVDKNYTAVITTRVLFIDEPVTLYVFTWMHMFAMSNGFYIKCKTKLFFFHKHCYRYTIDCLINVVCVCVSNQVRAFVYAEWRWRPTGEKARLRPVRSASRCQHSLLPSVSLVHAVQHLQASAGVPIICQLASHLQRVPQQAQQEARRRWNRDVLPRDVRDQDDRC